MKVKVEMTQSQRIFFKWTEYAVFTGNNLNQAY